jgi:endonuclease YncB( thermonuclease family)
LAVKSAVAIVAGIVVFLSGSDAAADPCKAIPDRGPMPTWLHRGATFSGPVAYVGDGDSLCVATRSDPTSWVEVRLADFYAPELHASGGREAKAALERLTMGRTVTCSADHRSYDRIVAVCRRGSVSIGDLMRRAGVSEGGNAFRSPAEP